MNVRDLIARSLLVAMLSVVNAVLVGGCASTKETPPTVLQLDFRVAADLNPNIDDQPSPLMVRVYELRASGGFAGSDFFALFDREQAVLGADLVARDELKFTPGGDWTMKKTLEPGTRYVGIMAAYRKIDEVTWRTVLPVRAESVNKFTVTLGGRELSVEL